MQFFYYIFEELLIPPTGFLSLALFGLALRKLSRRSGTGHRLGGALLGGGLVLLVISGLPITATLLKRGLEAGLSSENFVTAAQASHAAPQAIVVLAGDTIGNRGEGGLLPGPQPGPLSMGRLRAAVALERITDLPILITGSNLVQGAVVSDMMRQVMITDYAMPAGKVPPDWQDHDAHDTWENADNAAAILRKAGIGSVYIVTDGWHMRRALIAFRHTGLKIVPAPVALTRQVSPILADFLPRVKAWQETYYALHEWLGCAYYTVRG